MIKINLRPGGVPFRSDAAQDDTQIVRPAT
jgi:hypothetical protein